MSDAYDSPWKEILQAFFPQFLALLFPRIYRDVDWTRGYESLDQELPKIFPDTETGHRVVDKLVKVWRKNGEQRIVLVHVELQGSYETGFPLRMFTYHYRLFDRFRLPVVSLAVLGDDRPGWRPSAYHHGLWGCDLAFRFPSVKLWDYNERWPELEASRNPVATAVLAHLKTRATSKDPQSRLDWKLVLARSLYEKGHTRKDVVQLFRFIDWLLRLPPELQERFDDDMTRFEREKKMQYVTHIERRGIRKGRAKGMAEGRAKGMAEGRAEGIVVGQAAVLKRLLTRRFRSLPEWAEERLQKASRLELESWIDRVLDADSLEDVFAAP